MIISANRMQVQGFLFTFILAALASAFYSTALSPEPFAVIVTTVSANSNGRQKTSKENKLKL